MFNIIRRAAQNNPSTQPATLSEWDPFALVESLLRYDPYGELAPSRRAWDQNYVPRFDVKETKDAYIFTADLPGVKEEDLEISLTGNRLSISGKRGEEQKREGENYYMVERSHGAFSRSFTLPDTVDTEHVAAECNDGVLSLTLPKRAESQPRRINVSKSQPVTTAKKAQS